MIWCKRDEKGQALVEMAIVLPLLLLLLMAIIDFGRVFHGYLAVTAAAREGARQAALGATDNEVRQTIMAATSALNPSQLTVVVTPSASSSYPGQPIHVEVRYRIQILTPGMQRFFPNPYNVIGQAVMKKE